MINISNKLVDSIKIKERYSSHLLKSIIVNKMSASNIIYEFNSISELDFEINLRVNIVAASKALDKSKFSFEVFRKSKCNSLFWTRTAEGGFLLEKYALASEGINDMFINGSEYAIECATAIVIIYYKALLEVFGPKNFNKIFAPIHLMNWHYLDNKLGISSHFIKNNFLPGDCVYFKNPDVNPLTPEWQGENAIDLGDGTFYGHGLGIVTREEIIYALNENRKTDAKTSTYLTKLVTKLKYKQLEKIYSEFNIEK